MSFEHFIVKRRVTLGFVFGFSFLILAKPYNFNNMIIGSIIALFGELIRVWASGCIIKNDKLACSGPYGFVRHPLYFGSFIMGIGLCISIMSIQVVFRSIIFFVLYLLLFFSVYLPVMKKEENVLKEIYKDEYLDYINKVKRFIPNMKLGFTNFSLSFKFKQFIINKEYKAVIGLIFALVVIYIKYFF